MLEVETKEWVMEQAQDRKKHRNWGGRRKGAGRKPKGMKAGVPHVRRESVRPGDLVHVTMQLEAGIPSLLRDELRELVLSTLDGARALPGARLAHHVIQSSHIHLIVEAGETPSLGRAMKGLAVRLAKRINRHLNRKGRVFADRYEAQVLSPADDSAESPNTPERQKRRSPPHAGRAPETIPRNQKVTQTPARQAHAPRWHGARLPAINRGSFRGIRK
jgi:hypothetical protein